GDASTTWNDPSSPCGRPTRPTRAIARGPARPPENVWSVRRSGTPRSLDDVDEDAPVVLDRGGLDDRPERLGGAPAASDDLSVVILVDGELEHQRAVVLLVGLHLDLVGVIDEEPREILEQLFHGRLVDALRLQELLDRLRGLGAHGEPVADALLVEHDRRKVGLQVVATES